MKMTYDLAMAAGKDAADARMRKAGRAKWTRGDYNEMVRVFDRLYPVAVHVADLAASA